MQAPTRSGPGCAALLHDDRLALIRRDRPDGVQHSLPGGLVEPGEDPHAVLRRELLEELGLDLDDLPTRPRLCFAQDQATARPGRRRRPHRPAHRRPVRRRR
ncbi:NUDIX hydrolase [Kitasatospora purpeofusca]|uniref:NUDIX hydrolase n=1 Tax=Kitasatospora purpeofusca TaxID=67352 RepID=UPI00224D49E4|nr:NUDIX hydrolase [Kitasatospora purpeofusca]MCX4755089.1 NUDIX hydrolase [Kitasatospora purpeofusca]WSR37021.1 NUDIX hydrolase [Kitasatospora purpeofusca]WSR37590.1 NUDIX hydrolase [Kitasatospora purpeofusca]